MRDFSELILCEERDENVSIHVWADLKDGALTINGQDLGPLVEKLYGDADYEYRYAFDQKNTARLAAAIRGNGDFKAALQREFGGEDGCEALRELCREKGIKYRFSSYA